MTMPAPSSGPSGYPPPPKARGNGCLWGCLILALILITPPILLGGYGAWFLYDGYRRNPVVRMVGELVRSDGMAQQALGTGAVITGVEGNAFTWVPGRISGDYHVTLQGPKGEGHLIVRSHHSSQGPPSLDSAILTGPDGRRYDLLKHQQLPDDGTVRPDTSI
jgi:Cytochrome oxidase complex assembly protein 1